MPREQVWSVTDSFDGKELDGSTEPVRLQVGDDTWNLFLSEANSKKFFDQIEKWTKNETPEPVRTYVDMRTTKTPARRTQTASGLSTEELMKARNYLQSIDWKSASGKSVSDRGRIAAEALAAWELHKASL